MENTPDQKTKNIIFILIDDLGWKDLSCYGSSFYETPNLDRLSTEGVRFTEAYSASPVCSPTRASILTGKNPGRLHTTQFFGSFRTRGKLISARFLSHLPHGEKTIAQTLKENGYSTFHVGKWHLGKPPHTPENHGYDVNIGGCHWGHPAHGYFSPYKNPNITDGPKGEYLTDRLTDEAIGLIEKNKDKPFFLYLAYYSVHIPIQAPKDLIEKYEKKAKQMRLDTKQTFLKGDNFPCTHKKYSHIIRRIIQSNPKYAAMIERLDWNIGRILKKLEAWKLDKNTVIIFFSDNGGLATAETSPTCNAPLSEGKGWMYEGGTRVPLIIKWPNVTKTGKEYNIPVMSMDFYPTILEMLGLPLKPEQHVDGMSLVPLLRDGESKLLEERPLFWYYPHYSNQGTTPASAIRHGKYKLINHYESDTLELYDLAQDISESNNIIDSYSEIGKKMQKRFLEWSKEIDANLPEPNRKYGKYFGDIICKLIARGFKFYTLVSPTFRKIRKSISKFSKN